MEIPSGRHKDKMRENIDNSSECSSGSAKEVTRKITFHKNVEYQCQAVIKKYDLDILGQDEMYILRTRCMGRKSNGIP